YNQLYWYKNPKSTSGSWPRTTIDSSAQRVFHVAIADIDNDNDNDIIAACYDGSRIKYYNQTSTGWTENNLATVSYPRYVRVLDFNGDGKNDTLCGGGSGVYELSLFEQGGSTSSWTKTVITNEVVNPQAYSAFDMDGDDDYDFMVAGTSASQLVQIETLNASTKDFELTWIADGGIKDIRYMDYMDMDEDGDEDMVFISYDTGWLGWWENDGTPFDGLGNLHKLGVLGNGIKIMLGDIDGDDDQDIAALSAGGVVMWYENAGDPFSVWQGFLVGSGISSAKGFYLGDFTGDGQADVAVSSAPGYRGGYIRLYQSPQNPKQSNWPYNYIATSISYMSNIWADDLDLDGDLDIMSCYGSYGSGSAAYYRNPTSQGGNPTSGKWAASSIGGGMYYPEDIKSVDINDDGYPDVVVSGRYYYSKVRWFENPAGGGSWTQRTIKNSAYNWYLAVGDIGNDGYADIVLNYGSYSSPTSVEWYEEPDDLSGSWIRHFIDSHSGTRGLGIADLDGDGVQEIMSTSISQDEIRAYRIDAIYPQNVAMDVGADESTPDWPYPGLLKGTQHITFTQALQETVDQPGTSVQKFTDSYGTHLLNIPLEIYSQTLGKIGLENIIIRYNATVKVEHNGQGQPLSSVLDRLIPDYTYGNPYLRIYVGVGGDSKGMAYVSDLFVEFNAIPKQSKAIPGYTIDEDTKGFVSDDLRFYFRDDYTDAEDLEVDIRLTGAHANKIDASINNNRLYIDSTLTENFYTRTSEPYDIRGILVVT
ncbi:MAG: VCBS repeat-containing protein, partial [Candidatus Thermoplasmatota archaeon]|nr:VCBS repeat-containing protein [Candidatus Thermoplasmatota archaeon]